MGGRDPGLNPAARRALGPFLRYETCPRGGPKPTYLPSELEHEAMSWRHFITPDGPSCMDLVDFIRLPLEQRRRLSEATPGPEVARLWAR